MKQPKKTGKTIPYDYESAYPLELEKWAESAMDFLEALRSRRDIYATKEIRAGEQLEVEIYPEFRKGQGEPPPPEAKIKQREAQRNLNDKNSRKQCERVINENFGDRDIWATFTYTREHVPRSMEEAQRNMQNYIRRINRIRKKAGLPNLRYVYVTECSQSGRWHHHIVMDGDMSMDDVEAAWTKGKRNQVRRLQKDENGLSGMAHYLTKEPKGQKRWVASKGLRKPKERVNHYKFQRKEVRMMIEDENAVKMLMEKWYAREGYIFTSSAIRYNGVNGRFYIYARLRRPPERGRKKRNTS